MFQLLKKREQRIIQQIHHEFDTAEERLLQEAKDIIASAKHLKITDQEKRELLKTLGFSQHPLIKEAQEINNLNAVKRQEAGMAEALKDHIMLHRAMSPYKFITEAALDQICKKYKLVHASVEHYIGTIPEKNLNDLKNLLPVRFEFLPLRYKHYFTNIRTRHNVPSIKSVLKDFENGRALSLSSNTGTSSWQSPKLLSEAFREIGVNLSERDINSYVQFDVESIDSDGLHIAAPKRDFNLTGLKKREYAYAKGQILQFRDPVVFRYVKRGLEILTKWGTEASDPILLNEKDN